MFDGQFSSEFVLSWFRRGEASKGVLLKVEDWVDGFGEDSIDLGEDVEEDVVEAFDFSSFGGG